MPANTTAECDNIPATANPTANDNCDTDVEITFSETTNPGACDDQFTIIRTWTATDNCGNQDAQTQIINVQDTTNPVLDGVPTDETVECDAVPAPASPTATDNCDNDVNIDFAEVRTDGACDDTYTLTRTWTATDNCGNQDIQTQIINVQDTSNPILDGIPADETVECDACLLYTSPSPRDS